VISFIGVSTRFLDLRSVGDAAVWCPVVRVVRPSLWFRFARRTIQAVSPRLKRGEPEQVDRLRALSEAFRPSAPIDRRSLFSGRTAQLGELFAAVDQPGQHAVVFGERGVGKTSLTAVAAETLGSAQVLASRTTCDRSDDFGSVWRKSFDGIQVTISRPGVGFGGQPTEATMPGSRMLGDETPHAVLRALQAMSGGRRTALFIDEFDRLPDEDDRLLFADTIKALSDQLPNATIVLIGVADDVEQLVTEHRSIERALVQIHMPRMSTEELSEIVVNGLTSARVRIDKDALETLGQAAEGLPHYAHLFGQLAGRIALEDLRTTVRLADAEEAVAETLERRPIPT
jgi:replication-associated recombination protein RarA